MKRMLLVVILLGVLCAATARAVPTSRYYLTNGDVRRLTIISGGTFSQHSQGQTSYREYPIAVNGVIVTAGWTLGEQPGGYYDLSGNFLGPAGTWTVQGYFFDGTTDGRYNYSVDYARAGLYQFGADWSGGALLFSLPAYYLGITYDPVADTFWVSTWIGNLVEQYDRSGNLVSSFNATVFSSHLTCLALDYADRTLWLGSQDARGQYAQYALDGTLLGTASYGFTDNTLGGEFDLNAPIVPVPSSLALVVLGVASIAGRMRRRSTN